MWLPLVVGVDGSASSLRALDWAVDEAARLALPLKIVHATMTDDREPACGLEIGAETPCGQDIAQHVIDAARERARTHRPDLKVTAELVCGDAVTALLNAGRNASALVTGARGRGELKDLLLGSVSLVVAARAQCPVVVVRDGDLPSADRYEQILLGVADAESSSAAVRFAFEVAAARGCALDAVMAWHRPPRTSISKLLDLPRHEDQQAPRTRVLLDEALKQSAGEFPSVDVHRIVEEGSARDVLLKHSEATDLLVVGAQRRLNRSGLHLGRVNHALLHYAACPVALVPQWN
ncbi:universal stress protein [Streptomyces ficellus]|uniref:Universal stress protein n=2 Tax=Streptomyces ficellus TaxID=1977088 RepID=A0A6I6FH06_9ACTN|nr:universal stress protein [Streptomyces ficellus]